MYHCRLQFYLAGSPCAAFDVIREMPVLENFTHEFSLGLPQGAMQKTDVVVWNLSDSREEDVLPALSEMGKLGEVILLAEKEQLPLLSGCFSRASELWVLPMEKEEIRFRFLRWQQRSKQEKDLWEARQYLEATINSVPNLVWYKTKDGIHEKVNDSFCQVVNKTKEQVQGRGHAYIWDVEQDDPACIESEREVMSKRETCISEETIQTGEGLRQLTTYKSPLYDYDGSVAGTVGIGIDVTKERDYEQEIIRKNQTLETLFTTMDAGVMCHTLDGSRVLSVNRAALKILDYESKEELEASGFDMVAASVLDEDKPELRRQIKSLQNPGDNVSVEYRVLHRDNKLLHVMGNVKLVEEDGELFYQRFLLDITTQKLQEEKEKLERERRQTELVEALSIDYNLVCFFDLKTGNGDALRMNDCRYQMLAPVFSGELSLDRCMEEYLSRCVHPDDREVFQQALTSEGLSKELFDKRVFYLNYRTLCNGEVRYFQMKAVRLGEWEDSQSVILGFRSVDEETRLEMEKKSLLEDALMQARQASKAKTVFLSNMSHDIRTPMNAIVGFTSLAINHIEHKDQVEGYLKKIMTSGNHLLSLINDVLDMSRIESGKMYLEEKPCSLPEILHGLRNIVQGDVHAKQLELYMDAVDVQHEEIYCDKLRLNQVLLNLLSNAVKYTPPGGEISIRVMETPEAPEGCASYEFLIKDTGVGMSEEFVERIFDPFERESNSTISGIQGTGLGMAITKNIVDMMNGVIEVKSELGVGTEIRVLFTFRLYELTEESQVIEALKDCRALVVDDDFNTCDTVSCMLQQFGMRAEWTLSGKEAVLRTHQSITRNDNYSVYIIDWLLPDMNGIEVARRIRMETGEDTPIIVLTAYDWSDIEEEAKQAGVTAFCSKPLFLSELRRCLDSVVTVKTKETENETVLKPPRHTGRILLVEDNELNQEIAEEILKEAGFQVEIAGNGKIAVEMVGRSKPGYYQLILMDVQMPVMDGHEASRTIRNLPDRDLAQIPIIAMTANAFEEDRQAALRNGMNAHIAKPINIPVLFETLDKVLKR